MKNKSIWLGCKNLFRKVRSLLRNQKESIESILQSKSNGNLSFRLIRIKLRVESSFSQMDFSLFKSSKKIKLRHLNHTKRLQTKNLRNLKMTIPKLHSQQKRFTNKPTIFASKFLTGIKIQTIQFSSMFQRQRDLSRVQETNSSTKSNLKVLLENRDFWAYLPRKDH